MNAQLKERLTSLRIEVPSEVEEMQLERIAVALCEPPGGGVPPLRVGRLRHRLAPLASAVALVVLPGAAALAAEGTVPGDVLYPVKQATEVVRSWFDPSIAADHRIDELETVIDRGAPGNEVTDRLRDATVAVEELDDPAVTDRLHRVRDTLVENEATGDTVREPPVDTAPLPPADDEPLRDTVTTTSSVAPSDRGGATADPPGDADRHSDEPPPDEPPSDDRSPGDDRRGD